MARRTKDEAEQTRNAILNAAEQVFYKFGVARTSLQEVAKAAGVTRGAVYWHFRDKIELLDAMAQRVFLPQEDILEQLTKKGTHRPLADLNRACCDALRLMVKDTRRRRIVSILNHRCEYTQEMAPIMNRRYECKDRMLSRFVRLFEQAQKLKMLSPEWTPRIAAMTLQNLMSGLIINGLERDAGAALYKTGRACLNAFFKTVSI